MNIHLMKGTVLIAILQMRKLRPERLCDLAKITQLKRCHLNPLQSCHCPAIAVVFTVAVSCPPLIWKCGPGVRVSRGSVASVGDVSPLLSALVFSSVKWEYPGNSPGGAIVQITGPSE